MNDERPPAPDRVPTLTEVVLEPVAVSPVPTPALAAVAPQDAPPAGPPAAPDHDAIAREVLGSLQQRIDLMFEYRVREALTPLLEELAREIVARARLELGDSLRQVVARAVAQELSRRQDVSRP